MQSASTALCQTNFEEDEELRQYLLACPKFGNNIPEVDEEARQIANTISDLVASQKNYLGNPFRPDWSSPSTHLLYGYWVGATPDGRMARDMLGYGVDPLYGEAGTGLGFRVLSGLRLPLRKIRRRLCLPFRHRSEILQGQKLRGTGTAVRPAGYSPPLLQ